MTPRTKMLILTLGACALAVWSAFAIAEGNVFGPVLIGAASLLATIWRVTRLPVDVALAGIVLSGYLIGNRGFAQLAYPGLPLFPGELLMLLSGSMVFVRNSRSWGTSLLSGGFGRVLAFWILYCGARLVLDMRTYGLLAIRDFAVVYYALLYYFARDWARTGRGWVEGGLRTGLVLAPITFELFRQAPMWLTRNIQIMDIPLIYIKSDSAAGLMAGGAAWFACLAVTRKRWSYGAYALVLLLSVTFSNSRAALVSVAVILGWLLIARAWALLRVFALAALIGLVALTTLAVFSRQPWHESEIYRTYERIASIMDFASERDYRSILLQDKGDNNEFRLTWWAIVARDTWETNRWLGCGFGYDLTARFASIYYPEAQDDLSVRSPHSVILTIFGRTGLAGLAAFLGVLSVLIRDTWRNARRGVNEALGLQLFAWGILVSACFGVVLEGPMGAVVFWSVLGLARGSEEADSRSDPGITPSLQADRETDSA